MTQKQSVPALKGWRPHDPAEWSRQMQGLSLATRGALATLADALWVSTLGPCAIPKNEREIAAWCGARVEWNEDPRLRAEVMSVLEEHPSLPGMLSWGFLLRQWQTQLEAHETRKRAGSSGGRKKAAKTAPAEQLTLDPPVAESSTPDIAPAIVQEAPPTDAPAILALVPHIAPAIAADADARETLAMPSNARQKENKRELLFSAPRREKQFSSGDDTPASLEAANAPPAFVASDARGASDPPSESEPPTLPPRERVDWRASLRGPAPPTITRLVPLAPASTANALREAQEREYYARQQRTPNASPSRIAALMPGVARDAPALAAGGSR